MEPFMELSRRERRRLSSGGGPATRTDGGSQGPFLLPDPRARCERRRGDMAFRVLCVLSLSAFAIAIAGDGTAASLSPPSARVRPAAGWIVVRPSRAEQPKLYKSMVVAVTTPDVAAVHPFALFTSLKGLSARGVLLWVTTIGRNRPSFERMPWPPRLASLRVERAWELQPAPNVQQRLEAGVIHDWDLDVRVYFGTQHPDRHLLEEAQAELDRLRLPVA
jgi:hypothetical protein